MGFIVAMIRVYEPCVMRLKKMKKVFDKLGVDA